MIKEGNNISRVNKKIKRIKNLVDKGILEEYHLGLAEIEKEIYLATGDAEFVNGVNSQN